MDIQLTDFENAAFTVFITLASRVLLSFQLNTYIPVTKSDENMTRAHLRDAVTSQKFWFRSHLVDPKEEDCPHIKEGGCCSLHEESDRCEEMTILEFMTGKGTHFPGFVPLIMAYSYVFIKCGPLHSGPPTRTFAHRRTVCLCVCVSVRLCVSVLLPAAYHGEAVGNVCCFPVGCCFPSVCVC